MFGINLRMYGRDLLPYGTRSTEVGDTHYLWWKTTAVRQGPTALRYVDISRARNTNAVGMHATLFACKRYRRDYCKGAVLRTVINTRDGG